MTVSDFNECFTKVKTRWPKFYNEDMDIQIFGVCRDLPKQYLSKRFKEVIWNANAPRIDWFHQIASDFRKSEENFQIQKADPREDSIFTAEDVTMMFNMIKKQMSGLVQTEEWDSFTKWVETTAALSKQRQS